MISNQSIRNAIWTASDLISYPLLMIIATPFFIRNLGVEQYGLWMLISVIVQVMNSLNFGVGDSTIKEISQHHATQSIKLLNATFNRNLSLSILLMFLCVTLCVCFSKIIEGYKLFNIKPEKIGEAMLTLVLFSLSAGMKFIELVFLAVFKGLQRFDISAKLSMLSRLSVVLSALLVVHYGYGILKIVQATLICNLINLLVQISVLKVMSPVTSLIPRFAITSFSEIIKHNGWYWLQSVIALMGFLSDRFIIGYLTDLKTVGYYSIATLVGSQIHNILLAFGSFVFPKVAAYNKLQKSIHDVYYVSRFFIATLGWMIVIFLLLFGDFIFKLWLGQEIYLEAMPYIKLYLAFTSIIILIIIPFHFINGSKYVKINSLFEFILRTSHIIAMLFSYRYFGMSGLLWSLIIITLINIPFQYYLFNKVILNINNLKEAFLPFLPTLPIIFIAVTNSDLLKFFMAILCTLLVKFIYYNKARQLIRNIIPKRTESVAGK